MAGALSIASAVLVPEVDSVVAFYGVPSSQLVDPAQARAPVQAHFGELDNFVGFWDVTHAVTKAMEEKLKSSGVPSEVYIYPGNGHAFMNWSPDGVRCEDEDEDAVHGSSIGWPTRYLCQ